MASAGSPDRPSPAAADGDLYRPWLRLRLRHGHLASAEGVGHQLALHPCRATAQWLRRLEMVNHEETDGVSLLLKDRLRPSLATWLESGDGGPLQWRLIARQGSIWGCTAVPLAARCRQWHLHGSTAAGQTSGELAVRLLPVAERELVLTPPPGARSLQLLDGRGGVVRELPLPAAAPAASPLAVSLDLLPEGCLQPSFDGQPPQEAHLHLPYEACAIGLLSLWLPAAAATAGPLAFECPLPGRQTIWHYLLVPRQPGDVLEGVRISGEGCVFHAPAAPEILPDGRRAWRMVGATALPLLERSPLRFRLEGQRLDAFGQSHRLVIDPLPLAPAEPVWPGDDADPLVGVSEMVVPV
jgi:hypothetical protein